MVSPRPRSVTTSDAVLVLQGEQKLFYQRGVSKAMQLVPLRSNTYYVNQELARSLQSPTNGSTIQLRHLLRCPINGAHHYRYLRVRLSLEIPEDLKVPLGAILPWQDRIVLCPSQLYARSRLACRIPLWGRTLSPRTVVSPPL